MEEQVIMEMTRVQVLEALKELKNMYRGLSPSKFYFAIGHAIRAMEDNR